MKTEVEIRTLLKTRSSHWRHSVKKVFLNILQKSQENTCVEISFSIKLQALQNISGLLPD